MSDILQISYDTGGYFYVRLDEDKTDVVAADVFNQLAIDGAFERRAPVILELDGNRIRRVQSDVPRDTVEIAVPGGFIITRISTQVQEDGYVAEILYVQPPETREKQVRSKDPVIHLLCHGAYLSKHRLELKLNEQEIIEGVVKKRFDLDPGVAASQ